MNLFARYNSRGYDPHDGIKAEAHRLLDRAKSGEKISKGRITWALRITGDLEGRDMKDLGGINSLARLKLRCKIDEITECWNWSMSVCKSNGLPIVNARFPWDSDRKIWKTTGKRAAVLFKIGRPLKNGWFVWGTCANPICCNPEHAEYGDADAYGKAKRDYGWHKNKPAHYIANRQTAAKKRKLTDQQADEIRESNLSEKALSKIYGLSPSGIGAIKRGKRYVKSGIVGSSIFSLGRL
jgi:hypothetical protein